ncbi:hypothetical protein ES708_07177 [subsurface metagenome]
MKTKPWLTLLIAAGAIMLNGCGGIRPLKVVFISGSNEYFSDISLPAYKAYLERSYQAIEITLLQGDGAYNAKNEFTNLDGLEALDDCDVLLTYTRRMTLPDEQINRIKRYVESGGNVVAIRTASHGYQNYLEFDQEVLGGNYHDHYPGSPEEGGHDALEQRAVKGPPTGPTMRVTVDAEHENHPVLFGVSPFSSRYSLYKVLPLSDDAEVLLHGTITLADGQFTEPVAWTREHQGRRICYITAGGLQDWENATFRRLVANAIFWAGGRELQAPPAAAVESRPKPQGVISLPARTQREAAPGSDRWKASGISKRLPVAGTAILICDMWDQHWCRGASERVDRMVGRMGTVVSKARDAGIQIIHAPSATMAFYAGTPQRLRAQLAPEHPNPTPLDIPDRPLPIDDSDGGCDTDDYTYRAWTRQHPGLEIGAYDVISDDGDEIYNYLREEGITNLIIMGVHTNMCVLNRSFAIKQMTRWGIDCLLVRDLTDTMYDPKDRPFVSHDEGTELVVKHIEKFWCPSIHSADLEEALEHIDLGGGG